MQQNKTIIKVRRFLNPVVFQILNNTRKGYLVGGSVRDFLLTKAFPRDFDIEISRPLKLSIREKLETLPFGILRMKEKNFEMTFSPPRREIYEGLGPFGHGDFRAEIDFDLYPEHSFKRRDLTINALGLAFDFDKGEEFTLVDPFGGLKDLEQRIACGCSEMFTLDPVRFTRLIRFCLQLNLTMDERLCENLRQFNLSRLTNYYVFKDSLKVPFFKWVHMFFALIDEHGIALNNRIRSIEFLKEIDDNGVYPNRESILKRLIALGIPKKKLDIFCQFSELSLKKFWS